MRFHRVALLLAALTGTNARVLSSRYPANPLNSRAGPESQTCASFTNAVVPFRLPPGSELLSATLTFCTSPVLFVLSMSAHLCPPEAACLCISDIPTFITTDASAIAAVALAGSDAVAQALRDLVSFFFIGRINEVLTGCVFSTVKFNAYSVIDDCEYPELATPQCLDTDPCSFTCSNGFIRSGGQCICAAPNTLCNGNCVPPTFNCPSSVAPDRRRWDGASECNSRGGGHMACGVYGRGARVWECIDTDNDLESCKFSAELINDDRV